MVRIDGTLRRRDQTAALHDDLIFTMLRSTMDDEVWETFEQRRQVDYSLALGNLGRFRVNAYHQLGSPAAAFRAISPKVPTLAEIGVPPEVSRMTEFPYGLVLFVGPTGSGKSTTQAALVGKINAERPCHILTIEDPVEYLHGHGVAMVNQREVGNDVHSFADGLRSALREDPDIILLGEMRDEESISITLTLAETGHLVFATLHTNDARPGDRPHHRQLPGRAARPDPDPARRSAAGCRQPAAGAARSGSGRAVACEVMVANEAVRNLIREGKTRQLRNVIATGSTEGMRTMESSLDALVQGGAVAYEEAIAISQYPKEIRHPALSAGIAEARRRAWPDGADACRRRSRTHRSPGRCRAPAGGSYSARG